MSKFDRRDDCPHGSAVWADWRSLSWRTASCGAAPPPVSYDPAIVPAWKSPTSDTFAVIHLAPWHLRVFPGSVLLGQGGRILT